MEGLIWLTLGSEMDEGVGENKIFARAGKRTTDPGYKAPGIRPSVLSTKLMLYPSPLMTKPGPFHQSGAFSSLR